MKDTFLNTYKPLVVEKEATMFTTSNCYSIYKYFIRTVSLTLGKKGELATFVWLRSDELLYLAEYCELISELRLFGPP